MDPTGMGFLDKEDDANSNKSEGSSIEDNSNLYGVSENNITKVHEIEVTRSADDTVRFYFMIILILYFCHLRNTEKFDKCFFFLLFVGRWARCVCWYEH